MGWVANYRKKRAARLLERKSGLGLTTFLLGGNAGKVGTKKYTDLVRDGYNANADVRACLDEISAAMAGIPWILRKKQRGVKQSEWEPVLDNPFYDLWDNPCAPLKMTSSEFVDMLVTQWFLAGEAFTKIVGPMQGPPTELWLLPPDKIEIEKGGRYEPIKAYKYKYDENKQPDIFAPDEIIHTKFNNPTDPYRGLSPLVAALVGIDQGNEGRRWNLDLMRNGGVPAGIMALPDGQKAEIEGDQQAAKFNEKFHTKIKALGTFFSGTGAKWDKIGLSPAEAQWLENLKLSTRDICKVMRVPPEIIGDPDTKTFANWEEARRSFYMECILPLMDRLRDIWNLTLVPRFGVDLWLDYDISSIEALQENENDKWARVKDVKFGTWNEKRRYVGWDEIEGGDIFVFSPTDMPVAIEDLAAYVTIPKPNDGTDVDEDEKSRPFVM